MSTEATPHTGPYGELIETTVRVLSWNIWWRFGPWEARLPAIAATLARIDPDIVALQEVWDDGTTNQAQLLAEGLGHHHVDASRREHEGVSFGNAILSRWPITDHEWRPLPAPEDAEESRTVLRADVEGPRGTIQVFSTHLNWRFDHSHVRQEQVRAIARFVKESPPRTFPPVVCGDFNADPRSDEIRMMTGRTTVPEPKLVFHDAWEAGGDGGPGHTWSNDNPYARLDLEIDRRIDYVFAGWPRAGGAGHTVACRVEGTDPVDGIVPSDHYAVLADLRY
ncbi:MAG: endonuclease/exonuclease/phosphatase family protein [Acidimicrobiales bacterium]